MEEREIKIVTKVFFAISIILGSIFLFFIWGIARVDAANFSTIGMRIQTVDGNTNDYSDITNSNFPWSNTRQSTTGLSRSRYILYLSYNFDKNNMYNTTINLQGILRYNGGRTTNIEWNSNLIETVWYDGSKEYPLSCNVSGTRDVLSGSITVEKDYSIQIDCNNVRPSKNMTQIRVKYKYPTMSQTSSTVPILIYQKYTISAKPTIVEQQGVDTDAITSNANANAQKIINANEAIGDSINNTIDGMKESLIESGKVCEDIEYEISYAKRNNYSQIGYLNPNNGTISNDNTFRTSDYIKITNEDTINITRNGQYGNGTGYCLYNENKEKIRCQGYGTSENVQVNITENGYIRFSGITNQTFSNITTILIGKQCKNGNQSIFDKIGELYGIDDWEHENPDKSKEEELEGYEDDLADYLVDDSDISNLDYSVDTTTNQLIWQIFTNTIQQNQVVFTAIISILFLGVIKLLLAR